MAKLPSEALDALREMVYHKCEMWDASVKAERILGVDIDTAGDAIDNLAVMCSPAGDAFHLSEEEFVKAFDLTTERRPMNASKEEARKARKVLDDIENGLLRGGDTHDFDSEVKQLQTFLAAAERKLPSEKAYAKDKKRKVRS